MNNNLPSNEELTNVSNNVKKYKLQTDKSDCEYMMRLVIQALNNAITSDVSQIYSHVHIDTNKIKNTYNTNMNNCTFGPSNETTVTILKNIGIKLDIDKHSTRQPFVSYDKEKLTMTIFPK